MRMDLKLHRGEEKIGKSTPKNKVSLSRPCLVYMERERKRSCSWGQSALKNGEGCRVHKVREFDTSFILSLATEREVPPPFSSLLSTAQTLGSAGTCGQGPLYKQQRDNIKAAKSALGVVVVNCMGMGVDPWTLEEVTMDAGLPSVWGSHESIEVLKHKLLCATLELETLRANAKEEVRKREENINQLFHLLQVITHERDVARDQLQLVLKKITQPNTGELSPMSAGSLRPDSPQMRQTRGSCSMTESDSLSGTPTHHSYGTSPVESFFDAVAPPELSSFKMGIPHQQRLPENKGTASRANSRSSPVYDRASAIIDSLVMKKPLPQKGKLLQAVLEAGPMLQTLLLAGPLPQWRNPPPPLPFQVPPVDVKPHSASLLSQMIVLNSNNFAHSSLNSFNHEMLNFPSATGLCTMKRTLASPCVRSYDDLNLKRQKTQCTGGA